MQLIDLPFLFLSRLAGRSRMRMRMACSAGSAAGSSSWAAAAAAGRPMAVACERAAAPQQNLILSCNLCSAGCNHRCCFFSLLLLLLAAHSVCTLSALSCTLPNVLFPKLSLDDNLQEATYTRRLLRPLDWCCPPTHTAASPGPMMLLGRGMGLGSCSSMRHLLRRPAAPCRHAGNQPERGEWSRLWSHRALP